MAYIYVNISIECKTFANQHFHILFCGCSYPMGIEYLVQILKKFTPVYVKQLLFKLEWFRFVKENGC